MSGATTFGWWAAFMSGLHGSRVVVPRGSRVVVPRTAVLPTHALDKEFTIADHYPPTGRQWPTGARAEDSASKNAQSAEVIVRLVA